MLKTSAILISCGLCLCSITACARSLPPPQLSAQDEQILSLPIEVDIFSARGFLGGSEYERYYFREQVLWRECGQIVAHNTQNKKSRAISGDEVFTADPNLAIEQRRVEEVNYAESLSLRRHAAQMFKLLENKSVNAPAPGSVTSLRGPGLFEMSIRIGEQTKRLVTSIDAVADKKSAPLSAAHDVFSAFRGVGPVICDSATFFGIPRSEGKG